MKIAISGAGVAGPALAYWLLRAGHTPTLIEKAPRLRTGGYIVDFWGVGYAVAERMGALPAIRAAGYLVKEVRVVDRAGRKTSGFSAEVFQRALGGRFTSVARGDLAAALYGLIDGRIEALFGDEIVGLTADGRRVGVQLTSGASREFDLVIGADGLHSAVRRLAFGPQEQFERRLGYYVAAFEVPGYRPRDELVYVAHAAPGRQVARFAMRGDRTMFLFIFIADLIESEPSDPVHRKAALREVFGGLRWETPRILNALDDSDDLYFDRVSQIEMPSWSKGRVALVGDAAACVSLLAGEGTGLGLAEAYVLAGELNAAVDHGAAFTRYEERLRPLVLAKQKSARAFAKYFAPRTAFGQFVRDRVTQLLGIPVIGDYLARREFRDGITLPDYPM